MKREQVDGAAAIGLCLDDSASASVPHFDSAVRGVVDELAALGDCEWRPLCLADIRCAPAPATAIDLCGCVLIDGVDQHCDGEADECGAALWPPLPVIRAADLREATAREHFLLRIGALHQWRQLLRREPLTLSALQRFHARYKYLVMSRDVGVYRRLGPLLSNADALPLPELAQQLIRWLLRALARPASRAGNSNALLHIRGYLKHRLSREQQRELSDSIAAYRRGEIPLSEPLALLRDHFCNHPDPYIGGQVFLQPVAPIRSAGQAGP